MRIDIERLKAEGYRVWTDHEEWIVAKSREEICAILTEAIGEEDARENAESFEPMEVGEPISVGFESEADASVLVQRGLLHGAERVEGKSKGFPWRVKALAEAWVAWAVYAGEGYGHRLIASNNI